MSWKPTDDRLSRGIFFFNEARYFDAHEIWEDLWRETATEDRLFYQGLIHAAVGMYHLSRRNLQGAESQFRKALLKLDNLPPDTAGIDLEPFRQNLRKVLGHMMVEGMPEVRIVRLKSEHDVVQSDGIF